MAAPSPAGQLRSWKVAYQTLVTNRSNRDLAKWGYGKLLIKYKSAILMVYVHLGVKIMLHDAAWDLQNHHPQTSKHGSNEPYI